MAYWGNDAPTIKYGASYTDSIDLSDMDCNYELAWVKERVLHRSAVTGHVNAFDRADSDNGRMSAEIVVFNIPSGTVMDQFRALRAESVVKLLIHSDATGGNVWEVLFVVERYKPFASGESGLPYPQYDSVYLRLVSQDYVDLKQIS
ncbi:MAG: hypothetical protein K8R90_09410 [Candidatus Cloacimonetes bacterium]|nr:hypothetical protein [Candidatus Cloacimonadota bacterium]